MVNLAQLSNEELLAGSTDEKIDRLLLFLRDHAKDVNDKIDKHVEVTKAKFIAIEEKFRLKHETTERLWQEKYDKLVKRFNKSEMKQENEQVLTEYHIKKYNMIINRIPEDVSRSAWESNLESIEKVQNFFKNDLAVEGAENMHFVNAHRMGERKAIENPSTGAILHTRPMIVRFSCMADKEKVQSKLFELRNVNHGVYHRHRMFVTDQLPKRMEAQRKALVQNFIDARKMKKKAKWVVDQCGNYCLYVDRKQVLTPSVLKKTAANA